MMDTDHFVELSTLTETAALPIDVAAQAITILPNELARVASNEKKIHRSLAESYNRVISTDFTKTFWMLSNKQDVEDTINWCMLGGSFLADFAMDKTKPRIFAWGLSPHPVAAVYALNELKGRDASRIPTAACTLAENVISFVNTEQTPISHEQIMDYMRLGPAGIRVFANERTDRHYVHDAIVQFIIPGVNSPYADLVRGYLQRSGHKLMGVTSGNFSSKGKHASRNGGTHKNLDEIQANMGFLGIPILAGPIGSCDTIAELPTQYKALHDPYLRLTRMEKEAAVALLPTSVTVVYPTSQGDVWRVARHGSLHYSVIEQALSKYGIMVEVDGVQRLDIGVY